MRISLLICAALLWAGSLYGQASTVGGPLLPQAVPSVVYPNEALYPASTSVASGANLQTAINGAACGTILDLATNGSWSTATAYTLPNTACACHTDSTKWVIIRSHAFAGGSVRGTRIDPSAEYSNLAHISSTDTNYAFTATSTGQSCYWFLGLDVLQNAGNFQSVFNIGDVSSTNYAHDFVWDHSYIHFTPIASSVRCLELDGNFEAVVDSYLSDCHRVGNDGQAIESRDGLGGVLIQNNFLEGATENMMVGGAVSFVPGVSPCDFTIQKNHFFKPLTWQVWSPTYAGVHFSVKNLFENKNVCRELVTSNVFQNNWQDSQNGVAILFDVENVCCGGTNPNPAAQIADINFNLNLIQNSAGGGNIAASNSNISPLNQPMHRFSAHDDLYTGIDECLWGQCGSLGDWYIVGKPPLATFASYDISWNHETISSANMARGLFFDGTPLVDVHYGYTFTNSIIDGGGNGVFLGNAGGTGGNNVIPNYAPTGNFKNLCAYGTQSLGNLSNVANSQTPANVAAIFVNPGTDFHVAASSVCHNAASDGLDMGANINAVNTATVGVVQTIANPVTVTNISPTTFTHLGGTGVTITGTNFVNESGLGVIIGGAGPVSNVSTVSCSVNTCTVVMSQAITLSVNDTIAIPFTSGYVEAGGVNHQFVVASVTDTTHFTYTNTGIGTQSWSGGTLFRYTPGNACTSVSVTSSTTITCNAPAATGTVTTGPVSVFVSQWGIPVQSTVFGNYN